MPGYVSHTVMANCVYDKLKKKNVNLEYLLTYSLGGDLCKYAKCRYDSHHINQDKFIYTLADYIKNNNLVNDDRALGLLYGHICHYIMDDTVHPLVRKIDKECIKNKKNHSLIEEYYDKYLVNEYFKISLKKYLKKRILNGRLDKQTKDIINYAYYNVYNTKNVSKYYRFNLFLYRNLRNIFLLFPLKFIENISGLNRFLITNKNINITNNNYKISYKSYNRNEISSNLNMLFDESVLRAIKYINDIDEYLKK